MRRRLGTLRTQSAGLSKGTAPRVDHLPGWDGLRAVAATSVLVLHAAVFRLGDLPRLEAFVAQLQAGVQVFFVASGFMVARPFVRAVLDGRPLPGFRRYAWRRALRIFPAYWLALVVSALVFGTSNLSGVGDWITQLLLIQVYWDDQFTQGIGVAWTLSVELAFYLLLPLLMLGIDRLARRMTPWRALVGTLVAVFLAGSAWVAWTAITGKFVQTFWFPFFLPLFAAGMLLCVGAEWFARDPARVPLMRQIGRAAPLWWAAALGWLLVSAALFGTEVIFRAQHAAGMQVLYTAAAICACVPFAIGFPADRLAGRVLTSAPLVSVGVVSYGVYIWHSPLTTVISEDVFGWNQFEGSALVVTATVFVVSVGVAALSWSLVERPLQRFSRRVM